jgi:hypothetical protein
MATNEKSCGHDQQKDKDSCENNASDRKRGATKQTRHRRARATSKKADETSDESVNGDDDI